MQFQVLTGRGLVWHPKNIDSISPIKIESDEPSYIAKICNEIKLINIYSTEECEILCTNDQKLLEMDSNNQYIFRKVN